QNEQQNEQQEEQMDQDNLILIDVNITNINDLIKLGEMYNEHDKNKYTIDLKIINKLMTPLKKLQSMIGLSKVKQSIVEMVLYFLQHFEKKNNFVLHTSIEGPPGVGKTELAMIIAEIYANMGITKTNKIIKAKGSDFKAKYVGHGASKTEEKLMEAKNGILFIDEVHSFGHDNKNTIAKEALDTLTYYLLENDPILIIAGYEED